jgi:hypothetical protein
MKQLLTFAQLDDNFGQLAAAVRELSSNPSLPYVLGDQAALSTQADTIDGVSDDFHSCYNHYAAIDDGHASTANNLVLSALHLILAINSGVNNTYTKSYVNASIQHAVDAIKACIRDTGA